MEKNKNVVWNLTSRVPVITTEVSVVCCLNVLAAQTSKSTTQRTAAFLCKPIWWNATVSPFNLVPKSFGETAFPRVPLDYTTDYESSSNDAYATCTKHHLTVNGYKFNCLQNCSNTGLPVLLTSWQPLTRTNKNKSGKTSINNFENSSRKNAWTNEVTV